MWVLLKSLLAQWAIVKLVLKAFGSLGWLLPLAFVLKALGLPLLLLLAALAWGLMIGVEIVDRDPPIELPGCHPSAPRLASRIQHEALRRGLILELGGRHNCVVRFLPPLIVTAEQIDTIATIFSEAVKAAEEQGVA